MGNNRVLNATFAAGHSVSARKIGGLRYSACYSHSLQEPQFDFAEDVREA